LDGLRVMVVDDTAFMRMMMRNILEDLGHEVVGEAQNGLQAVQMYQQLRPGLVTMDITMPEMDGIGAVKKIMQIDPAAKIVMCSAMGQRELVLDAIFSGASDFVVKPIQKDRIIEAINNIMSARSNSATVARK
jgi:two-component system, chemotaxis family, chemotaxis protein CheY